MITGSLASISRMRAAFPAGHAAHPHVHDDEVGFEFRNELQAFFAAGGRGELDFRRIKNSPERVLHVRFVIDQQQLFHPSIVREHFPIVCKG